MVKYPVFLMLFSSVVSAQTVGWQRTVSAKPPLELFHAQHVAFLPTAETLSKGELEFEVSHRFVTPVKNGYDDFYGADGPANIRLALGYAVSNRLMTTVGRTNVNDNLELQLKWAAWERPHPTLPLKVGLRAGAAYNSQVFTPLKNDSRRLQFYGQLLVNTLIGEKVGIGVVPSYLYNAALSCCELQSSATLGSYVQYYVSPHWSLMAEWNSTVNGWRKTYDSFALGFELETGGHFFKVFFSNNDKLNTAQYLAGADKRFEGDGIRLGFVITRLIKL